jgi:hypothetical protein
MNTNRHIRRAAGAVGLLAVLLPIAACGNEVLPANDLPAPQAPAQDRPYPPTDVPEMTYGPKPTVIPADAAKGRAQHQANRLGRPGAL